MNSNPSKHYDDMAEKYVRKSETSFHNAYYERPAIKALLTDLEGKVTLDIGCAGGILTEWLVEQGALVTGIDISQEMVNHAQKRLKNKAKIIKADISEKLDFVEDNSIDVIVASLVLHYVNNWLPVFEEFQRILKKDGMIVFSVHHPHADWLWFESENYFKKELIEDSWTIEGTKYPVTYYHRTLANMFAIFKKFNFYVDVLLEPLPVKEGKEVDQKSYETLLKKPWFLFLRLKKLLKD